MHGKRAVAIVFRCGRPGAREYSGCVRPDEEEIYGDTKE